MRGYELMTQEQRQEWQDLEERATHRDTMRMSPLDCEQLDEYRALSGRLEAEHSKELSL